MSSLSCQWKDCTLGEGEEEGGRYRTPTHLTSLDQAVKLLEIHSKVHEATKQEQPNLEDRIRKLIHSELDRYKQCSSLSCQKEIEEQPEKREAFKDIQEASVDTEEALLPRLKRMVVSEQGTLLNILYIKMIFLPFI